VKRSRCCRVATGALSKLPQMNWDALAHSLIAGTNQPLPLLTCLAHIPFVYMHGMPQTVRTRLCHFGPLCANLLCVHAPGHSMFLDKLWQSAPGLPASFVPERSDVSCVMLFVQHVKPLQQQ
jgi:hypothetical protein